MQVSSTSNALYTGLGGMQNAQRRVDQAALEIAGSTVTPTQQPNQANSTNQVNPTSQASEFNETDLTESLVDLRMGEIESRANARVIDTADEVLGTLIDTRA